MGADLAARSQAQTSFNAIGYINVKYPPVPLAGAKGDWNGTSGTDDTAAIQAIINYVAGNGGGKVLLPKGSYKFTNLVLKQGVVLEGTTQVIGNSTVTFASKLYHVPTVAGTDGIVNQFSTGIYTNSFGVRNVSITASPSGNSRYGISFENYLGCVVENIQFNGYFSGAPFASKGAMICIHRNFNVLYSGSPVMPCAVLLRSYNGDIISTTSPFEKLCITGSLNSTTTGITTGVYVQAASTICTVFKDCMIESIVGNAYKIEKGNRIVCNDPYIENVPNTDINTPIFETGVVGQSAPNNAYDSIGSLVIKGGFVEGCDTGSSTSNILLISSDFAYYVIVCGCELLRVNNLINGTNNTQKVILDSIDGASVTTIQTGLTSYKIHNLGGNHFGSSADVGQTIRTGLSSSRDSIPTGYLNTGDFYFATNIGNEGSVAVYNKSTGYWSQPMPKLNTAPTTGAWRRGDTVFNAIAANGRATGWQCVTDGTPGTWVPFGQTGYISGSTTPVGSITPDFVGQDYLDNVAVKWYKSTGTTSTNWVALN